MSQAKQAATPGLTCDLHCARDRFIGARNTFSRINAFLEDLLIDAELTGAFRFIPLKPVPGSAANKECGFRFTRVDGERGLMFVAQLGANDSAWECRLLLPKGYEPDQVRLQVEKALASRNKRPEKVAKPEVPEPPLPVCDVIANLERVALIIGTQFPLMNSCAPREVIADCFIGECRWSEAEANQAIQALVNRKQLKLTGGGDLQTVSVLEGALATHLVLLGAYQKQERTPLLVAEPTPVAKELRHPARNIPAEKTVEPKPIARLVRTAPHEPSSPAPRGLASQLEDLERKAQVFGDAQLKLREARPARNALVERRNRAQKELNRAKQELAELDQGCADATSVVSNPEYSQAAAKLKQIRAIMKD